MIKDRRDTAVKIDFGEGVPVWFYLPAVEIDEVNYTITGSKTEINNKLKEARGGPSSGDRPVKLAPHSWKSKDGLLIGIDVKVFTKETKKHAVKERIFIETKDIENGTVPARLISAKKKNIIRKVNKGSAYSDSEFIVSGLTA